MKLTNTAWIGTLITKSVLLLRDFVPQTTYQVYTPTKFNASVTYKGQLLTIIHESG